MRQVMALGRHQLESVFERAGGNPQLASLMASIALRESGGRPRINNRGLNRNGTVDWGLWQINDIWRKDPIVGKLFRSGDILTPEGNARAAIRVLGVQGPRAWATFQPGTDSRYLSGFGSSGPLGKRAGSSQGPLRGGDGQGGGGSASALLRASGAGSAAEPAQSGVALLQALQAAARPAMPVGSAPAPPALAAHVALPGSYQAPASGAGGGKSDIGALMDAIRTPGAAFDNSGGGPATSSRGGAGRRQPAVGGGGGLGKFQITGPNPGRLQPGLVRFARKVAGIYGSPLTGSDGSTHSKYTVGGNISDHWSGHATDIPAAGKTLTRMGQAALIAAGMKPSVARKQRGGLFNINGHQIIFNTDGPGIGNHYDHLHVSAR